MTELLQQLATLIQDIIRTISYPGIALVMFAENVFPPIPSELVMPFAGFLAATDPNFTFLGVWIAGVIGSVAGAIVLYYIGLWAGDTVIRRILRRYGALLTVSEADYDRALRLFDKYGNIIVFVGRLIPIIRSIISIPAGADHMPLGRFLLYTTLGSAIWSGALAYAGMVLGENWEEVIGFVEQYQDVVVVVAVVLGVLFVGWFIWRAVKQRRAPHTPAA
jgi:membrane protein DedA with SNARE-associated domain